MVKQLTFRIIQISLSPTCIILCFALNCNSNSVAYHFRSPSTKLVHWETLHLESFGSTHTHAAPHLQANQTKVE